MTVQQENKMLRARLRRVATGVKTDRDDAHLRETRTTTGHYQGGCALSPGELTVLYRMQSEGTL